MKPYDGTLGITKAHAVNDLVHRLARMLAIVGGGMLFILIALTTLSVAGRALNTLGHADALKSTVPFLADLLQRSGAIDGDYELIEAGIAAAIFAFLPWASVARAHATVDAFTSKLPFRMKQAIDLVWEAIFSGVLTVVAWRLILGAADKARYGETTFLLQFPMWWPFALCAGLAVAAAAVSLWMVAMRTFELAQLRDSS